MSTKNLIGRIAYCTYTSYAEHTSVQSWEDLTDREREIWSATADAVWNWLVDASEAPTLGISISESALKHIGDYQRYFDVVISNAPNTRVCNLVRELIGSNNEQETTAPTQ